MQKLPMDGFELDFEVQLLKLGVKKYDLAKRLGISQPTLATRIKDPDKFTIDNYKKLMDLGFKFNI